MWIYILERTRHFTTEDLPMNRFFDSTNLERNWQTDCKLICFNSSSLDDDLRGFQWFKRRGFNLEDTTCIAIVTKCHPSYPRESSPKWPDIFLLSEIIDSISFFTVQVFEDPAKPSGTTFCHFSGSQKWQTLMWMVFPLQMEAKPPTSQKIMPRWLFTYGYGIMFDIQQNFTGVLTKTSWERFFDPSSKNPRMTIGPCATVPKKTKDYVLVQWHFAYYFIMKLRSQIICILINCLQVVDTAWLSLRSWRPKVLWMAVV